MGAKLIAKRFENRKCHHHVPVSASECLLSCIGDKNNLHFLLATQDFALKDAVGLVPGVPILSIYHNCLVLEKPSETCIKLADKSKTKKMSMPDAERSRLNRISEAVAPKIENPAVAPKVIGKRKPIKGPNPLSMKKKKTMGGAAMGNKGKK